MEQIHIKKKQRKLRNYNTEMSLSNKLKKTDKEKKKKRKNYWNKNKEDKGNFTSKPVYNHIKNPKRISPLTLL